MYLTNEIVKMVAEEFIKGFSEDKIVIFTKLTVGVPGLDRADQLKQVADILAKVPERRIRTISWADIAQMGYKYR